MIVNNTTIRRGLKVMFFIVACGLCVSAKSQDTTDVDGYSLMTEAVAGCPELNIRDAIERLSSGRQNEMAEARTMLRNRALRSRACRAQIIEALLHALNKPNLNFELDRASYFLWRGGASLLGELKALEAVRLLIEHLDLNDGLFSASMVHQPAITGLIAMGPIAIPQLRQALLNNHNSNIRIAAAFCLTSVGGNPAMNALREGLHSEPNQCVSRFIRLSIVVLKGKKNASADQLKVRGEWLMAFRCN
jgi:hypothetical protein